jgi:hypothetical protein
LNKLNQAAVIFASWVSQTNVFKNVFSHTSHKYSNLKSKEKINIVKMCLKALIAGYAFFQQLKK